MLPNFSGLHVQRCGFCAGQLAPNQTGAPALGDNLKHAIDGFIAPRGRKPDLAPTAIRHYANQINPLHISKSQDCGAGFKERLSGQSPGHLPERICPGPIEPGFCRVELLMRQSLPPQSCFGRARSAWPETDLESADLETVIQDLIGGKYRRPIKVAAINTEERWSEDVSEDVAREIQRRCNPQVSDVPSHLQKFVGRHAPQDAQPATCLSMAFHRRKRLA
jgi:hypothetical protein